MYQSQRDPSITTDIEKKNRGKKHVYEFVKQCCHFYPGASCITEDAYDRYVRYCKDKGYEDIACFNAFARSFRFIIIHSSDAINGVGVFPCNYQAYKEGWGYVNKQGWSYSNLTVNY